MTRVMAFARHGQVTMLTLNLNTQTLFDLGQSGPRLVIT